MLPRPQIGHNTDVSDTNYHMLTSIELILTGQEKLPRPLTLLHNILCCSSSYKLLCCAGLYDSSLLCNSYENSAHKARWVKCIPLL